MPQSEVFAKAGPTICEYCEEPHPAIEFYIGEGYYVMPVETARNLANILYDAILRSEAL